MMARLLVLTSGFICCVVLSVFVVGLSEAFDPESIQGAWLFDEDEGDEVMDLSGKGRNGNITGNDVEWVEGKFGTALEFVSGGKVTVPHDDGFTTPVYTLMAWINLEKSIDAWQLIIGKDGWPNRNYGFFVFKAQDRLHSAFCSPGKQDVGNFNSVGGVADGEWHHVAATYDLKMRKIYIDGKLDAQAASNAEPSENNVEIEIGKSYTGLIDEVLIANEAFSEDDIKEAMEVGLDVFITGGEAVSASGKLTSTWGSIKSKNIN